MSIFMLSVIYAERCVCFVVSMLSVIILSVIVLNILVMSVIVMIAIMLCVIMPSVIIRSVIMLNAIMLSVIILRVIMLSVIMPNVDGCRFAKCRRATKFCGMLGTGQSERNFTQVRCRKGMKPTRAILDLGKVHSGKDGAPKA
jgi:hypothetical protein